MPSPQAVVTFVAILFLLLVALHVPLRVPAHLSAVAALVLALGAGWIVNRRVPDDDDDVTEDARNVESDSASEPIVPDEATADRDSQPTDSEPPQAERGTLNEY